VASHQRGVGFAVSNTDCCAVTAESTTGLSSSQTDHRQDNANAIVVISNTATAAVAGTAALSAKANWPANGFQLTIGTAFTASLRVHFLALGGSDLTNAHTGNFSNPTAVNAAYDVTTVGFQPDCVFFLGMGSSTAPPSQAVDSGMFLGFALSSTQQGILLGGSNDASTTTVTRSYCTDAECVGGMTGGRALRCRFTDDADQHHNTYNRLWFRFQPVRCTTGFALQHQEHHRDLTNKRRVVPRWVLLRH
jgi:hypothetical protein